MKKKLLNAEELSNEVNIPLQYIMDELEPNFDIFREGWELDRFDEIFDSESIRIWLSTKEGVENFNLWKKYYKVDEELWENCKICWFANYTKSIGSTFGAEFSVKKADVTFLKGTQALISVPDFETINCRTSFSNNIFHLSKRSNYEWKISVIHNKLKLRHKRILLLEKEILLKATPIRLEL